MILEKERKKHKQEFQRHRTKMLAERMQRSETMYKREEHEHDPVMQ
jgi:hypothetical protein